MCDGYLFLITDHKGNYLSIKDDDKKDLDSLLFAALKMQPFGPVAKLVMELLDVGVPVTIKDEVIAIAFLGSCDSITSTG